MDLKLIVLLAIFAQGFFIIAALRRACRLLDGIRDGTDPVRIAGRRHAQMRDMQDAA